MTDSNACSGKLIIPNAYGIAYIIDGQHRVYGYANSKYVENNTIPVVAFDGLDTIEQLEIFMDINQNQKAVSPSLRLDLEEDLYWEETYYEEEIFLYEETYDTIAYVDDPLVVEFERQLVLVENEYLEEETEWEEFESIAELEEWYEEEMEEEWVEEYVELEEELLFIF